MSNQYYVYILASKSRVLYTGVTNDLYRRVYQHKKKVNPGFTSQYYVIRLVDYDDTSDVHKAIT
jgi:putative endonuclease